MKYWSFLTIVVLIIILVALVYLFGKKTIPVLKKDTAKTVVPLTLPTISTNPLSIAAMRQRKYSGSDIVIEQTVPSGDNYDQYIASYQSDGLTIHALLTVPKAEKPKNGWPVIIFNHGYITPQTYQTNPSIGQYATYLPVFARNGYIVFKPDYRGNGNSDGKPEGAYYSPAYAADVLNALASIKKLKIPSTGSGQLADPNRIGMWGHSMGGNITLRDLVVDPKDIKVAVIWGGVVGSYAQIFHWHDPKYQPSAYELSLRNKYRAELVKQYGTPENNPAFWNSIDPTNFVQDITAPVQLHVGADDEEVPIRFSQTLRDKLQNTGKTVEYYEYPGADHNISQGFDVGMQRSVAFFDKYLK